MKANADKKSTNTAAPRRAARADMRAYASPMSLVPPTKSGCACGGGCPRCNKKIPLQTKLAVNEPGDAAEREADVIADRVVSMAPPRARIDSEVRADGVARMPRVAAVPAVAARHAPAAVHETLRGPGQPLDVPTRYFFESRFDRDFGDVRVHTGEQAAASARAVDALAYTVGRNVVFDRGQYAPHSAAGRHLLAHELTHVVQQSGGAATLQRAPKNKCPPFPPPGFAALVTDSVYGPPHHFEGTKGNFSLLSDRKVPVDFSFRSTAGPDPSVTPPAEFFGGLRWEFSGDGSFTAGDTDGLGRWVKPTKAGKAEFTLRTVAQNCLMAKIKIGVIEPIIIKDTKKKEEKEKEKEKKDGPTCGPNIGKQLADVLAEVRSTFGGWSPSQKRKACLEIITVPSALVAWDIHELYLPETGWLRAAPYFPTCGKPGPKDPDQGIEDKTLCTNSVEVDGKCFLAGTVNYALFGQMFRLCADAGQPLDMMHPMPLDRSIMKRMISQYKLYGYTDDDGPPSAWAEAGFDGYPGHVPSGANENRSHCVGRCPVKYQGDPFTWIWEPEHGETGR